MTENNKSRPIVLIDLDNTILNFDIAERSALTTAFREYGIELPDKFPAPAGLGLIGDMDEKFRFHSACSFAIFSVDPILAQSAPDGNCANGRFVLRL